jgi:hypothetical protein
MADGSYNQFCPVAMAAEILCTRWTIVLLRELVAGSTRFNELRRGVPRMSPRRKAAGNRAPPAVTLERRPAQPAPVWWRRNAAYAPATPPGGIAGGA